MPLPGRCLERRLTALVSPIGIRTHYQQNLNNFVLTIRGCRKQWRPSVTVAGVDFGPRVEKYLYGLYVAPESCG